MDDRTRKKRLLIEIRRAIILVLNAIVSYVESAEPKQPETSDKESAR